LKEKISKLDFIKITTFWCVKDMAKMMKRQTTNCLQNTKGLVLNIQRTLKTQEKNQHNL
jgi:hypothetical protein